MITHQHALTVITPVDPAKLDVLRNLLTSIQQPDIESNTIVPFPKLRSVHFARFVILEAETGLFPVQLAFSSNYDGPEKDHIAELIRVAQPGLQQIYRCCTGFGDDLERYWARYQVPVQAFYKGHAGLSVAQIGRDDALRQAIVDFLDQAYATGTLQQLPPTKIKQMVAGFIREQGRFAWALTGKDPGRLQQFLSRHKALLQVIALGLAGLWLLGWALVQACRWLQLPVLIGLLLLLGVLAILLVAGKRKLNHLEKTDPAGQQIPDPRHVKALLQAENRQVQNQLSHLVRVKPGGFRLRLLKLVLSVIHLLARVRYNQGELGGIPSIHFARWVLTDQDTRLLFFSNYDGSWENYLGDFIDQAAVGLTAVWSNTDNFPRTRNLLRQGAREVQPFKDWVRYRQLPTQVWYSAYKTLSVQNINNNAFLRAGLFRHMDEAGAQAWLDRVYHYKR